MKMLFLSSLTIFGLSIFATTKTYGYSNFDSVHKYPSMDCHSPSSPPIRSERFRYRSQIDEYNQQVDQYNSDVYNYLRCIKDYIVAADNDIITIQKNSEEAARRAEEYYYPLPYVNSR
ncbi:MAG: hypothetical protein HIU83_00970 [Proteobacteria bacterium]|nr:hypothetical protein [Pseudomonadota bacterium]